ncbi:MAG: hypothetical protein HKN36_05110 [Hellea sp.]|nr:hypothetical protein [Hellea sp.]
MLRRFALFAALVFGFNYSFAHADELTFADARALLLAGEYDSAISLGEAMGTADGLTLAAESISAKVLLGYVDDRKDEAKRARKLAAKALEMDQTSHEALVQYALAYGFEAQASSQFRAWRKKLPKKTRKAIDEVRQRFPDDPRGDALLGAWHLGIIREAGEEQAQDMFEANEVDGIQYYELALIKRPDDIIILSNYTASLLSLDASRHEKKAAALLQRIYEAPTANAVEIDVKTRMEQFRPHLENPEKLTELAETLLDGEQN